MPAAPAAVLVLATLLLAATGLGGQAQNSVTTDSIAPDRAADDHPAAASPAIDTMALRAHTRFLADDMLAGRGTGTPGERIAALYIGSQLMRLGIHGAASGGDYFQSVPLRRARVDTAGTTLSLRAGDSVVVFSTPKDFLVGTGSAEAFKSFAGEAVFVGDPGAALAAIDRADELSGSTVVVLGTLGEAALQLVPRWIKAGVAGVISLIPDRERFDLFTRSRGESRYYVTVDVQDPIWQSNLPMLLAGPDVANVLLDEVETFDSSAAPAGQLPIQVGRTVRSAITVEHEDVETANVVGLLPGSDPEVRDQVVVYTAHHDHLGISTPDPAGDSIYNGFSDNAAGTAMVLAIADAMRREPPARSVLFLFLTGEERGLLGSSYFAAEPPVPLERIVAVVNLDAGAPPAPPRTWRIAGGTNSFLGSLAAEVAEDNGWEAALSPASPNSDYWPFLARGIPSIFIIPGGEWEGVDSQEQAALRERWDHYHRASDHWAADFPFSGLRRYADFALQVGLRVADAETAAPR